MTKTVGMTYVKDFEFPAEQGFTGSAGRQPVKGYMRGGHVKDPVKAAGQKKRAPGPGAAHGGHMKEDDYSHGGTVGVTTPRRGKSMPQQRAQKAAAKRSTKKAGGGSVHDQLYAAGSEMGYMRGGHVKNTSAEFVQTTGKQDSMDHGVQPAQKGRSQAEVEAGGNKRLKAGYGHGGDVHSVRDRPAKRRAKSGKKMPKGLKARGGLARYAEGGYTAPSTGMLGKGLASKAARAAKQRAENVRATLDEAVASAETSMSSGPRVQDKPARPAGRKPAPGSGRGKRPHYGLPFKDSPAVK